jgi:hypothetical protein
MMDNGYGPETIGHGRSGHPFSHAFTERASCIEAGFVRKLICEYALRRLRKVRNARGVEQFHYGLESALRFEPRMPTEQVVTLAC